MKLFAASPASTRSRPALAAAALSGVTPTNAPCAASGVRSRFPAGNAPLWQVLVAQLPENTNCEMLSKVPVAGQGAHSSFSVSESLTTLPVSGLGDEADFTFTFLCPTLPDDVSETLTIAVVGVQRFGVAVGNPRPFTADCSSANP